MGNFYPENRMSEETFMPFKRTVGHEVEVSSGYAVGVLNRNGNWPTSRLCGYQCRCENSEDYPVHPTSDCSAEGGEFIIGGNNGVVFGSPAYMKATETLERALIAEDCGINEYVGMHTHVYKNDLTTKQLNRLYRNYLAYQEEFKILAAGAHRLPRSNGNTNPHINTEMVVDCWAGANRRSTDEFWTCPVSDLQLSLPGRPTLNFGGNYRPTVEFRIWNSTRTQWRMILAGGVSAAFVEAAKNRVDIKDVEQSSPGVPVPPIEEFLADYLTTDIVGLILRQKAHNAEVNRRA